MNVNRNKLLMRLRIESKQKENQNKPPLISSDVVQVKDFKYTKLFEHLGDSGQLLLAKRKNDCSEQYLVKHAYTDCACNEFVYTKLAQAMGYSMPEAVLFQASSKNDLSRFTTEYIIGERYLNIVNACPSYEEIRDQAVNWNDYFAFHALYAMTGESDGVEILFADDNLIYRVDTTDAFPITNRCLDLAGVDVDFDGITPNDAIKKVLLSSDFSQVLNPYDCDSYLELCLSQNPDCLKYFLEPFARIQEIRADYIDSFLNTLCYFYPDFIGEYFKKYLFALKTNAAKYLKEKQ